MRPLKVADSRTLLEAAVGEVVTVKVCFFFPFGTTTVRGAPAPAPARIVTFAFFGVAQLIETVATVLVPPETLALATANDLITGEHAPAAAGR